MKKGQIAEGRVINVEFPNKGIAETEEGSHVIVKNTIPGQRISIQVNKVRKGRAEARLLEILEPSPIETEARCPHFGICGGCNYQSLPYEEQLALKEKQVRKLLEPAMKAGYEQTKKDCMQMHDVNECESAGLADTECEGAGLADVAECREDKENVKKELPHECKFLGIEPSPRIYEYRNKMEFSFGDEYKDGPLSLGMHRRGSFYDIVTVSDCQIADEDFRRILRLTLSYFTEKKTDFFHRNSHLGYLRHLLVRKAAKTGEILIDLVTTTQMNAKEEELLLKGWCETLQKEFRDGAVRESDDEIEKNDDAVRECDGAIEKNDDAVRKVNGIIKGILHTHNDSIADVIRNDGTDILYGEGFFYEELLGLRFLITPFSFFQTNSLGAEVLYRTAREFIIDGDEASLKNKVVYDLYSGTGTIAQMMAPVCREVVGVEIVEEAVEAARENVKRNGLTNCTFLAGDVLKVLDMIKEKPDTIILDPPRDGIHPKALEKIIAYGVDRIVYISCKPTSLARDLEVFLESGYRVERIKCVDMFPGTVHIETVCLLGNHHLPKPDATVKIGIDMEDYYRIRDKEENKEKPE